MDIPRGVTRPGEFSRLFPVIGDGFHRNHRVLASFDLVAKSGLVLEKHEAAIVNYSPVDPGRFSPNPQNSNAVGNRSGRKCRGRSSMPGGLEMNQEYVEQPFGTCSEFKRGAVAEIAPRSSAARDAFSAFRHRCSSGCASKQVAALSPRQSQRARPKSCRLELLFLRQTRFIGGLGRGFSVAIRLLMPPRLNFYSKCATKSDQGIAPVERMVKFGVCCLIGARKRNRLAVILTIT